MSDYRDKMGKLPGEPLSAREFEVLTLMARGLAYAAIGAQLGISLHTVRSHALRLFAKLNVRTRAEAIVTACAGGLITAGPPLPAPLPPGKTNIRISHALVERLEWILTQITTDGVDTKGLVRGRAVVALHDLRTAKPTVPAQRTRDSRP